MRRLFYFTLSKTERRLMSWTSKVESAEATDLFSFRFERFRRQRSDVKENEVFLFLVLILFG